MWILGLKGLNILYNLSSDTPDNIALPCQQRFLFCMAFTVYGLYL